MPQSQSDMILDSITIDNIDEAMFFLQFYSREDNKKEEKVSIQRRYNDKSIEETRYQKGNKPLKTIRNRFR